MSKKTIDEMAVEATDRYLRESAMSFAECSIHLMLTCMSTKAVRRYLKEQRKILKEWE